MEHLLYTWLWGYKDESQLLLSHGAYGDLLLLSDKLPIPLLALPPTYLQGKHTPGVASQCSELKTTVMSTH